MCCNSAFVTCRPLTGDNPRRVRFLDSVELSRRYGKMGAMLCSSSLCRAYSLSATRAYTSPVCSSQHTVSMSWVFEGRAVVHNSRTSWESASLPANLRVWRRNSNGERLSIFTPFSNLRTCYRLEGVQRSISAALKILFLSFIGRVSMTSITLSVVAGSRAAHTRLNISC